MVWSSSSCRRNPRGRIFQAVCWILFSGGLAGCVDSGAAPTAEAPTSTAASLPAANHAGVAARGVTVALTSLTGAPEPVEDRMRDALAAEAKERDVALGDTAKAAYFIRGYATSYPSEKGTVIAVLYDVFDAGKRRAQRIEDSVVVKGDGADPWSGLDGAAMAELAAKSAEDIAAFLVQTPEASAPSAPSAGSSVSAANRRAQPQVSASAASSSNLDDSETIVQRARSTRSASAGDVSATVFR